MFRVGESKRRTICRVYLENYVQNWTHKIYNSSNSNKVCRQSRMNTISQLFKTGLIDWLHEIYKSLANPHDGKSPRSPEANFYKLSQQNIVPPSLVLPIWSKGMRCYTFLLFNEIQNGAATQHRVAVLRGGCSDRIGTKMFAIQCCRRMGELVDGQPYG